MDWSKDKRIYNSGIISFISPFLPDFCLILLLSVWESVIKVLKKEHIFLAFDL